MVVLRRFIQLGLICLLAAPGLSCSFVEFELSPYAPRGFDVVYSEQEDLTFFVWRLPAEARPSRVSFELFIDGEYRLLDLGDTPFPATPYECDRLYTCFQFQLPGEWQAPDGPVALRAIDRRHGIFPSQPPRLHRTERTFSIDPIATDNNVAALPFFTDFFAEESIPIQRTFDWTLVPLSNDRCPPDTNPQATDWSPLATKVDLPRDWSSPAPCFTVRPRRTDAPGALLGELLQRGPMLYGERRESVVPTISHPTMVAFIIDLQIINADRCRRIIQTITDTIMNSLARRPGPYRLLGTYFPLDQNGNDEDGCSQNPNSTLPNNRIVVAMEEQMEEWDDEATMLLIYLNNIELPPSNNHLFHLSDLVDAIYRRDGVELFTLLIASDMIRNLFPADEGLPWAPLEDQNFVPNLESTVEFHFPLRSHDAGSTVDVPIPAPNAATDPEWIRFCSHSPTIRNIDLADGVGPRFFSQDTWPYSAELEVSIPIPPQFFVSYQLYRRESVLVVYEVCDAHCDRPFVAANGERYESWLSSPRCRWN